MEGKNFETDKTYAHTVANFLNMLADEGVLTRHDLAVATDDAIEEAVLRIHKGGLSYKKGDLKWEHVQKLKTLFSSETLSSIEIPSKSEITGFVKGFMDFLRPEGFEEITGAIVYGSLLDKKRKPRKGSDLDIMFLIDKHTSIVQFENSRLNNPFGLLDETDIESGSHYSEISELAFKFAEQDFPKFKDIQVNIAHVYNRSLFEKALNPLGKTEALWWLYSPGVYSVGGFKDMSESEVNKLIQSALSSEWLKKLKQKTIDDVKKDLMYDFGKDK